MPEIAYKFRIYPDKHQEQLIQKTFGCTRFVYNHYLDQRITAYKDSGETQNAYAQSRDLTQLKKQLEWLSEVDSQALKCEIRHLDAAYKNFFRRVKSGKGPAGFPKFKSKKNRNQSYTTPVNNGVIYFVDDMIKLPKLGLIKCHGFRPVSGRILNATLSQTPSGKYFVSVCCTDAVIPEKKKTGMVVGIDLGIKDFAITSDGEKIENHKFLSKSQKRLIRLQRQLSRKSKGSRNREKARIKVARAHEKVANQRKDMLQKVSTKLVTEYDVISIEDLRISNMVKNHHLAQAISDASWGEFARELEYKCAWYGKTLVRIDPFFPSSQLCSL